LLHMKGWGVVVTSSVGYPVLLKVRHCLCFPSYRSRNRPGISTSFVVTAISHKANQAQAAIRCFNDMDPYTSRVSFRTRHIVESGCHSDFGATLALAEKGAATMRNSNCTPSNSEKLYQFKLAIRAEASHGVSSF
ncbi:hypothetical protein Moror_9422, partial [Moniliophthora roreri MCA 2997]